MDIVRHPQIPGIAGHAIAESIGGRASKSRISPLVISEALRLYDLVAIGGSGLTVYLLYLPPALRDSDDRYVRSIGVVVMLAAAVSQWMGAYRVDVVFSNWLGLSKVLKAWAITFVLVLAAAFGLKVTSAYSRFWGVSWLSCAACLLIFGRYLVGKLTAELARWGRLGNRTVIVGIGEQSRRLLDHLKCHKDGGAFIVGVIDDQPMNQHPDRDLAGYPILGDVGELMRLIRLNLVDEVVIALPWSDEFRVRELVLRLATTLVRVRLCPDLVGFQFTTPQVRVLAGLPTWKILDRPISGWSHIAKMLEDQVIAWSFVVLTTPLLLCIAVAIKLDSSGPIFFKQRRLGFDNKLIEVWKFRTMRHDCADADANILTSRNDTRVTRVGRLLRISSLDELPQILNVLRGEMSIVGPRPHALAAKAEDRLYQDVVESYAARHRVKPGITGWAQVNGWRGETDSVDKIRKRVEYDLYYIDNWSVWLDFLILLKTIPTVCAARNAY